MSPKSLQGKMNGLYKSLTKNCREIETNWDADKIHAFRTDFKKLRSLLRWQKADKNAIDSIRKVYSVAGEIRNIQVVTKLIDGEKDIPDFFKSWLAFRFLKNKKLWIATNNKKGWIHLQADLKKIKLDPKTSAHFFTKKIKKIKEKLELNSISDSEIHEIRKLAKDIQYAIKYWRNKKRKDPFKKAHPVKTLKSVTSDIGNYNDVRVLVDFLGKYSRQRKLSVADKPDKAIFEKLNLNKEAEKTRVIGKVRKLI